MSTAGFVHLHTHSEYSDFDGLASVKRIVQAASDDDQGAVAITDHGRLASLWALRAACTAAGDVKPIPGMEAYIVVSGTRHNPGTIEVAADSDDLDAGGSSATGTKSRTKTKKYEHLTLLAATATGLRNLIEMSNRSQATKTGKYPLIDYELLAEYAEGLIVLTGCIGGPIAGPLSRITGGDPEQDHAEAVRAQQNLDRLIDAVGRDNVYIELADHGQTAQDRALDGLYALAQRNDLPVVVANDSHYVAEEDQVVHEAHIALGQKGRTVSSPDRYKFSGHGQFFRTEAQMRELRPDDEMWQRGCDETVRIADRVQEDIFPETRLRVPRFPIPAWFTTGLEDGTYKRYAVPSSAADETDPVTFSYFMHRVREGSTWRWGENLPDEVSARIKFELSIVCRLGVMDYFLLVDDLGSWARSDWTAEDWVAHHDQDHDDDQRQRKEPIFVGPGRGSAPGSAISYALGIVNVDPIANGLLFERFLDLERTEMPDIDVDFEKERRAEVIHYLSVRYGHDNVCHLGMHGTNKAKRALDSAGRYLELSSTIVEEVKKQLPKDAGNLRLLTSEERPDTRGVSEKDAASIREKHALGEPLRHHLETADDSIREMVEYAAVLEGVVVSPGIHPCGVVVSDENLTPLVPMRLDGGVWVTEWDGPDIADFGLLKMDVLGLRTLDIVKAAQNNVLAEDGEIDFDLMDLRLDGSRADATWDLLGRGDSTGVFQLESGGMRDLLTTARPRSLDDLSALIAAYRPGPMSAGMHTEWAERAGGHTGVAYDSLSTDPAEQETIGAVLGESQGVILFQEQMMRLGKIVGKFDAARANNLRRAISKKKQALIDSLKPDFIAGAQTEGVGEDGQTPVPAFSAATAERLWTAFEGSGEYAFNKSHTTAYGVLSYQTAYLKANHPAEFGAAVLRFTGSGKDKAHLRIATIRSLRAEGIEVKAPDINASDEFTVARDGKVWIGLSEIKDVGKIAATIVQERTRNGSFTSMADLAQRVAVVTIDADGEEKRRGVTSAQLTALAQAGAFDGFGDGFRMGHVIAARAIRKDPDLRIPQMEYSILEKATRQRATILAVTGTHPTKQLSRQIASLYRRRSGDDAAPKPPLGLHKLPGTNGARVHTGGIVSAFTERMTRRGSWMVTMELENSFTSIQMVGFSDVHAELKEIGMPTIGDLVEIRGSVRLREVEREVIDEVTGESSTQTIVEHSIILSGVEYMDVEDPDRDAEGDPELRVGALLADSTTHIVADGKDQEVREASAVAVLERDGDEEEFDPMQPAAPERPRTSTPAPERTAPRSATTAKSVSTRTPAAMVRRPRPAGTGDEDETRADFDAELSAVATTAEWERLFQSLQITTGHEFFLARPRRNLATGHDVGTFLRVETTDGTALVPVTAQHRLSDLAQAGRLPAVISTPKMRAVVIDTRAWREQLLLMNDAVNSGRIDPSTSVVDGVEPSVPRAG